MTIKLILEGETSIDLKKIGQSLGIDFNAMPAESKLHVVEYGIRQILNDAMAQVKPAVKGGDLTDVQKGEALAFATKRLDNLMSGTLRASPVREGNPVRARAMELAMDKIIKHPSFIAWCQKAGIKVTHKDAVKELRRQAKVNVDRDGNSFIVQAEKDVAAAKATGADIELDL